MANDERSSGVPDEDDTLGFMDQHSVSRRDLWKALSLGGLAALASGGSSQQVSAQSLNDEPVIRIGDNWGIDTDGGTLRLINDVSGEEFILRDDWIESQYSLVWDGLDTPSDREVPAGGVLVKQDESGSQFKLVGVDSDKINKRVATIAWTETIIDTTLLTFETTNQHDTAIAEKNVHHEQPSGTDWANSDVVEKGYQTIETDLRNYWSFEEDSGTTAFDIAGSDNGTITGASLNQSSGPFNRSYFSFDGVDDIVTTTTLGNYGSNLDTGHSVSFWVKTTSTNSNENIMGTINDTDGTIFSVQHNYEGSAGDVEYFIRDADNETTRVYTAGDLINDGNWHYVAVTHDGGATDAAVTIYVDGQSQSLTEVSDQSFDNPSNFEFDVMIGARNLRGTADGYMDVNLQSIRLWDRERTSQEVTTAYNAPL